MAASKGKTMPSPSNDDALTLPPAAAQAARLVQRIARFERWVNTVVSHSHPLIEVGFGARVMRRFAVSSTSGVWAAEFAARFEPAPPPEPIDMTVSPYVPPQRQISVARQGAADWASGAQPSSSTALSSAPSVTAEALLRELETQGWGAREQ